MFGACKSCHSSIISSDFRDYSWLRLGLDVGYGKD